MPKIYKFNHKYGQYGNTNRSIIQYISYSDAEGFLPYPGPDYPAGWDPATDKAIDIPTLAAQIATGYAQMFDSEVAVLSCTVVRYADPYTPVQEYPVNLVGDFSGSNNLHPVGTTGQFAMPLARLDAGTFTKRSLFGVSGLLNASGNAVVADSGAALGTPELRTFDFLNRSFFIGTLSGDDWWDAAATDGPLNSWGITREQDTDLEFSQAVSWRNYVIHNVNKNARKRYGY